MRGPVSAAEFAAAVLKRNKDSFLRKKRIFEYKCRYVSPFHRPRRPLGRVEVQLYSIFDLGTRRG
jgi:hypothetical protein